MKTKIISVMLVMILIITSYLPVSVIQASEIDSRASMDNGVKIKSFYSDGYTSAAITEDGELYCWGNNSVGTVGNGTFINQLTPVKILEDVREVFLSSGTSIAITTNGDLYCWGFNIWGQVGNGTTINQSTPIKILKNVMVFDADGSTFSAITTNR